jgi:long-chain acyl-CoA synthetase
MTVYPSQKPWLKFYDRNVPHSLHPYPTHPLHIFLERSARDYPDRPAVIFQDHVLTYRQLNDQADRLAAALFALGVQKGDRVGLFMPNVPQFPIAFYGILKANAVVAALSPLEAPAQIAHKLNYCETQTLLVLDTLYERFKSVQEQTPVQQVIVSDTQAYTATANSGATPASPKLRDRDVWMQALLQRHSAQERPPTKVHGDDTAVFQFTGGTTGVPKAAVGPHASLVANTLQVQAWLSDTQKGKEVTLMAIPLYHVYGMVFGMSYSVASAAALVMIPDPRNMTDLLENIETWRPTVFPSVPTMYNAINNHPRVRNGEVDLSSIRDCISGSAPLMQETQQRFEALTGASLREGYGLSEAPTATHCNPMHGQNRRGSIGLPFPDVECRIVNLDDGVTDLPADEIGELVIHAPNLMRDYWKMPEETARALRPGPQGKRWLHTGDIAKMDRDGYFYLVDRKSDMIIASGFKVYPTNVEKVLSQHPKILEVCIAGVPDPYRGETVKAWVVLKPGEKATEQEIIKWAKDSQQLAVYEYPRQVEFRDALPKTMVGKVLRRILAQEKESHL